MPPSTPKPPSGPTGLAAAVSNALSMHPSSDSVEVNERTPITVDQALDGLARIIQRKTTLEFQGLGFKLEVIEPREQDVIEKACILLANSSVQATEEELDRLTDILRAIHECVMSKPELLSPHASMLLGSILERNRIRTSFNPGDL